jgi:hypothetical protein
MIQRSLSFVRLLVNAIRRPSGDHAGKPSSPSVSTSPFVKVSRLRPPPSGRTT